MAIDIARRRRIIALSKGAITIKQYRAAETKATEEKAIEKVKVAIPKPIPEPEIVAKEAVSPLFVQPYERIQREALITPAPPVEREVKRVVRPRPAVWGARKVPPGKYITRQEEIPRLVQETKLKFATGKPTELATTPLGFIKRETQIKLLRARESYFEGMKKWWKKVESEALGVPYAGPALGVAVAAAREVTVGMPEIVARPGEAVAGLKQVVKDPMAAGYALGEELVTKPTKLVGELLAWYGVPKVPAVARRVTTATKEAAELARLRYRQIKYTGELTKPTLEVSAPKFRWRKEFPIPPQIEEAFGLRGKFAPADVDVLGRRPTQVQTQLWPKVIKEKPVITVEKPKAIPISERIPTYKPGAYRPPGPLEKWLPPVLTESQLRLLRSRAFKVTPEEQLIFKPVYKEVPSPRMITKVEGPYPFKPVPQWRKPFVGKKAIIKDPFGKLFRVEKPPMFDPFGGIAKVYKPKPRKEFVLEEELLITGVTPTAKVTPTIVPGIMVGLSYRQLQIEQQKQIQQQRQAQKQIQQQVQQQRQIQIQTQQQVQQQRQAQKQIQQQVQQQRQKQVQEQKQIQQQVPTFDFPAPVPTRLKVPTPKIPPAIPPTPKLFPPLEAIERKKKRPPSLLPKIPIKFPKTYAPTLWGYYGFPKIPARKELAKMVFTGILPRPGVKFPTRKKITKKKRKKKR